MRELVLEKLTRENFRPFGSLVDTPKTDLNFPLGFKPTVATFGIPGEEAEVAVFSMLRKSEPLGSMERHLRTHELFISLEGDFALPLTPVDLDRESQPRAEQVRVFHVREGQTVVMRPGLWHSGGWALSERAIFLIIFIREAEKRDTHEREFQNGECIRLKSHGRTKT